MSFRLRAQQGELPLVFEFGEHLKNKADAFNVAGEPVFGSQLDSKLAAEGSGPVNVTLRGKFVPPGGDPDDRENLIPWQKEITLAGPLDSAGLARATYGVGRSLYSGYGKNDTPPELYVTGIDIGKPKREPPRYRAAYQDSKTGHFVTREKYINSRRQIRANAKRKGLKRPPQGRYIRVLIPL